MDLETVMKKYDQESNVRLWEGKPKLAVNCVLALFSLFCLYVTLFASWLEELRLTTFVAWIVFIGILVFPAKKSHQRVNHIPWYDWMIMIVGTGAFLYFAFNAKTIIQQGTKFSDVQIVIGILGVLALAEVCRRSVGLPILIVAACFLIYAFTAGLANPTLWGKVKYIIRYLFYSKEGILSTPINVCSKFIVVFIIFGAFLERTGIADFFINVANSLLGSLPGGPAKVAVVASALEGMVSGSSVANTVGSGSVTIPLMKRTGYDPEFAAAAEASASTGGQIMPPIMGAAAFLMAEYMGIPYAKVAVKAILPAILYFTGIFIAVHLEAKKLGLKGISRDELPKWKLLARDCYLIIPLILLVWLVSSGSKTMSHSAAYSVLAAIAVGAVNFFMMAKRGDEKPAMETGAALGDAGKRTFFSAVDALEAGAKGSITVAVACAMAGIIAGCITVTGLASILINAIVQLAGNATIIGLVLTMLCCIVLGMGVPTTANYCIMASTCAPILIQLNFPVVAAHFFVFYFGIVADITPPVALAAYAGSAIAKSNPMKTGITATKLAIAAFIVPYIFAYSPALLFENISGWWEVAQICISALLGIFAIAASLNGFLYKKIHPVLRIVLAIGGLGMMIPGTLTDVVGLALVAAVIAFQRVSARKDSGPAVTA